MWLNHWIVAITYLHHTHPELPKYEEEAWTFIKGATATVDRAIWFVGPYLFHNIVEFHVIHHLFSRIPFYYGEEATKAIIPLLGDAYHEDKDRVFVFGLWESFVNCQWVEPDKPDAKPKDRAMWYKGGPSPPVETGMGFKGWRKAVVGQDPNSVQKDYAALEKSAPAAAQGCTVQGLATAPPFLRANSGMLPVLNTL